VGHPEQRRGERGGEGVQRLGKFLVPQRMFNTEWKKDNPLRAQFIDFGVDTYMVDFERLW
jgi:hypothetical protein